MDFRLAYITDLPQLKIMYGEIVDNMNYNGIRIWDDIYPSLFLLDDIENDNLYVLVDGNEVISAFALCESNAGENFVQWSSENEKSLYIDRLGVNVKYLEQGIGSIMIKKAIMLARQKGAKYLKLFVVDINKPAINLYIKNGFNRVDGVFDEIIDDNITLHEYGFEIEIL